MDPDPKHYSKQCFGSGSLWIRIVHVMAPLDPDKYWEYGSGSRTVKMVSKKGKNLNLKLKTALTVLQKV